MGGLIRRDLEGREAQKRTREGGRRRPIYQKRDRRKKEKGNPGYRTRLGRVRCIKRRKGKWVAQTKVEKKLSKRGGR